ncbi:Exodeoxyribonuclease 7 large subunit [Commensalibacter sp. Nvir]|uniref:exodeoxyribonuclease VII large subunit n=1 Tax=Commensalibacter sp. Nvir TaxID=3069817 RepID=UPI002D386574|nr:Exodeoxyribonuclease 7 large subunit [Commensalibacter sp. Nvir]
MAPNDQLSDLMMDNIPEFSVGDISVAIKRVLESNFSKIRVRGEITELKRYPSGHIYFSLKDQQGKLTAIIWRYVTSKIKLPLEDGIEVIATGKISSYGERSSYQFIVDRVDYAGEGALLARIEKLRKKLEDEGIFSQEKKRQLPLLPRVVGVITSPKGAVLHDIQTTIARRFPREIILWPVAVQGEGAAEQIIEAIQGFNQITVSSIIPRPDVLIIARGGGALEDLMAFNDENLVRAAANSTIPLISAVGHETDTTLIDFASDHRAPTPTAAAELAVPSRVELLSSLLQLAKRLSNAFIHSVQSYRLKLREMHSRFPDIIMVLGQTRMRLDDRSYRLDLSLPGLLMKHKNCLNLIKPVNQYMIGLLNRYKNDLNLMSLRINSFWGYYHQKKIASLPSLPLNYLRAIVREQTLKLNSLSARLDSLSPQAVLTRGYVLVRNTQGHAISKSRGLRGGDKLLLMFQDGERLVRVSKAPKKKQETLDL